LSSSTIIIFAIGILAFDQTGTTKANGTFAGP
jgi:hypothetical protein